MKTEVGSFTPSSANPTILLNDSTLQIKAAWFQICKTASNVNEGTGFDDSVSRRGKYTLATSTLRDSGRSTSYSMYVKKDSGGSPANAIRGKVDTNGFATAGEMVLAFDSFDNTYTVDFIVVGD